MVESSNLTLIEDTELNVSSAPSVAFGVCQYGTALWYGSSTNFSLNVLLNATESIEDLKSDSI